MTTRFSLFRAHIQLALALLVGGLVMPTEATAVRAANHAIYTSFAVAEEEFLLTNRPVPLNLEARLRYGQRLLQEAIKSRSLSKQAVGHRVMASAYQELRQYNQSVLHFQTALRLHQQLRNTRNATVDMLHLGGVLLSRGDTAQARTTYQGALRGFTQTQSAAGAAHVYGRLGTLYGHQHDWAQALTSQSRALHEWQQLRDYAHVAVSLNAIGTVYFQQRQYSRALFYLRKAMGVASATDSLPLSESQAGIGRVYQALGNQIMALTSFNQAEQLFPRTGAALQHAQLWQAIAATHNSLGNRAAAERALRQGLPLARRSGSKTQLSAMYQALAAGYRTTGEYKLSLEAMTRFAQLQDSVFAEERSAQVAELRTRYETEKKEREIQLLIKDRQIQEANLRQQTVMRNALAAGALLLLVIIGVLYRGRRQQKRINRLLERKNAAINRQKEELGRLNRTKDTLFSVISHDLRSPLSSLYSLLNLLNMGALSPERLALHSARLTRGLNSTLLLLDNLLNWSAAQMKDDTIRPERLRLDALVEEALALLLGDAERKSILLLNQLQVPTLVRADVNMTRLILRNLLGNAIKFTPEGGTVTVLGALQGATWVISVQDTGIGIQVADRDKVFGKAGPFSTLGTAHEKGTGLGLQLCQDFVVRNGGQLTFISQVGQGTTFRFSLPVATTPAAEAHQDSFATAAAAAE
ncbi:ATP-binding protein [Hymenobacter elongatus]|uniref:histidine kinase n=1 Tax=Hymenobacter elongatus TaxID=877208 RepID=A0A4Z0PHX8_9BACT|nr:ATP-binding protein [Hymenobacter elongatus]TGE14633.1 tetratricopeptide repeat protein [Hymenobacter elongatus]